MPAKQKEKPPKLKKNGSIFLMGYFLGSKRNALFDIFHRNYTFLN